MTRHRKDRAGRKPLTREQRKMLRERARAMKKTQRRKATPAEIMQIVFVVLVIAGIILLAIKLAG